MTAQMRPQTHPLFSEDRHMTATASTTATWIRARFTTAQFVVLLLAAVVVAVATGLVVEHFASAASMLPAHPDNPQCRRC